MIKKIIIIVLVCASLLAVSLTPTQAQVTGFNLDFTGGSSDCVSWINGVGGGSLNASLSGGSDNVVGTNNAGGAAPECSLAPFGYIDIGLVGFSATNFSMLTGGSGNMDVTLYDVNFMPVYTSGNIMAGTSVTYSGPIPYVSVGIGGFSGAPTIDNIIIGTPATSGPNAPRINVADWGSPVALFCTPGGGGLDIYDVQGDQGTLAHRISDQVLANALATAQNSGHNVQLISDADAEVWALSTGQIQVNTGGYAYGFTYQGVCGALPEPNLVSSTDTTNEEDNGVIINRPR